MSERSVAEPRKLTSDEPVTTLQVRVANGTVNIMSSDEGPARLEVSDPEGPLPTVTQSDVMVTVYPHRTPTPGSRGSVTSDPYGTPTPKPHSTGADNTSADSLGPSTDSCHPVHRAPRTLRLPCLPRISRISRISRHP